MECLEDTVEDGSGEAPPSSDMAPSDGAGMDSWEGSGASNCTRETFLFNALIMVMLWNSSFNQKGFSSLFLSLS